MHAIQVFESGIPSKESVPLNQSLLDLDEKLTGDAKQRIKANFFVYCNECNDLNAGKLRVRCSQCKEGSIIISREPQKWEDVLNKDMINGTCQSVTCTGNETFCEAPAHLICSLMTLQATTMIFIRTNCGQR